MVYVVAEEGADMERIRRDESRFSTYAFKTKKNLKKLEGESNKWANMMEA